MAECLLLCISESSEQLRQWQMKRILKDGHDHARAYAAIQLVSHFSKKESCYSSTYLPS